MKNLTRSPCLAGLALSVGLALTGSSVYAQHAPSAAGHPAAGHHPHGTPAHAGHPPAAYAGMQQRTVSSLSDASLADLRAGKGMGMALPAELNAYPGPLHVLELAEPLQLSAAQRSQTQTLFSRMQQEARVAGEAVIAAETALDRLFRDKQANDTSLRQAVAGAAQAQGALRETHLRYHLRMVELLSAEQVNTYNRLRGY